MRGTRQSAATSNFNLTMRVYQTDEDLQKRQLGLVSATALVIASMVGTGVFTTTGFLLGDLKSREAVLLVWFLGGIVATLGALCYGALARRIPESGGEYLFLSRTLHPRAGTVAGWISLLVGFSAPLAAAAFSFGKYTEPWLPFMDPKVNGTFLLVVLALIHAFDVRQGAGFQNLAVAFKVALMALFGILAASRLCPSAATPAPSPGAPVFAMALVWVSFSYMGYNAAIYVGGEVRDAQRNLPRALLLGTLIVTALYMGLNAVFVYSAPPDKLAGQLAVARIAAESLGGSAWGNAVTALVAIGLISTVSSMVMAGPRVYAQMAADGVLPGWLKAGAGPPRASIAFQLFLSLVLLWSARFESLLSLVGFTLSLCTAATVLGLVRLRLREGKSLKVPGWPIVPFLFLAGVALMTGLAFVNIAVPAWSKLFGPS